MRLNHQTAKPVNRAALAKLQRELAELDGLTVGELAQRYLELFGAPTRSRNKAYLQSHIAWGIQERAEGGLSPRALEQIEQLAPRAPARWRRPVAPDVGRADKTGPAIEIGADPRIPPAGATITRLHAGVEHRVTVLDSGFEYQGKRYRSLSKIACLITGKSWNGYIFFFGRGRAADAGAPEGSS